MWISTSLTNNSLSWLTGHCEYGRNRRRLALDECSGVRDDDEPAQLPALLQDSLLLFFCGTRGNYEYITLYTLSSYFDVWVYIVIVDHHIVYNNKQDNKQISYINDI